MAGNNLKDLSAFVMVAEECSFTRAAARLGVSQSALSQTIRGLEARLDLRLFARTTRSVSLTEAGERLLKRVGPAMSEIDAGLEEIGELIGKPTGVIRLTADEFAVQSVLQPAIARFLPGHPGIRIEITTDYGLADIVDGRFDAGVRRGRLVAKDMIAVRIGPDIPMAVVCAPSYLDRHPVPKRPSDLVSHACINLRLPTHGALYAWELARGDEMLQVRVDGQVTFNGTYETLDAALAGYGLAYVPAELAAPHVAAGRLDSVLADWCPTFPGHHLYYASRRQSSRALAVIVEALRYRA